MSGKVRSSLYVTDGSCCGGEESDLHTVRGFETEKGNFILSGKMIDASGLEDGFIVNRPNSLPSTSIFLSDVLGSKFLSVA